MWRRRYCKQTRREVEFRRFSDFVAAHPPEGLGTSTQALSSICQHSGDNEALDLLAQAMAGERGAPKGNKNALKTNDNNINNSFERESPTGTSAVATIRRLAKDAPELHALVIAGELSPNAAAIEAGFRKRKFQLPDDPEAAGRYLAQRVDKEWFMAMVDTYMKSIDG